MTGAASDLGIGPRPTPDIIETNAECLHYEVMVHVTIRDVPDDVRASLAADARVRGQSLQSYLLSLLCRQADFASNLRALEKIETGFADDEGVREGAPDAGEALARARVEGGGTTRSRARPSSRPA